MEKTKNFRNDLLKRQEIGFTLEAEKNPSFNEMREKIAEDFKKKEEVIDIYGVKGSFGSNKFKVQANIYDSKEDLEKARKLTKKQKEAEAKEKSEEKKEEKEEA